MPTRDLGDVAVTALTRPGAGSALLAALGVYLVLAGQSLLTTVVFIVTDPSYGGDAGRYLGLILPATLPVALGGPVPFAIGVFLGFWQIAPVAPQLRMAHVVTRALLAAVIGAGAALVIGFVVALVVRLAQTPLDAVIPEAVQFALPAALNILVQGLVVVPLAALLLWGWLQSHPPKRAPSGALDEV